MHECPSTINWFLQLYIYIQQTYPRDPIDYEEFQAFLEGLGAEDVGAQTEYQEQSNHTIVSFTTRTESDQFYHINFYKVIRLSNGTHAVFDFQIDAVQAYFGGKVVGQEQAYFQYGSFLFPQPADGGSLELRQVRICNVRERYDADAQICVPCADRNMGTFEFQQTECKSCGDMWYDSIGELQSLQALVASLICRKPAEVYYRQNSFDRQEEILPPQSLITVSEELASGEGETELDVQDTEESEQGAVEESEGEAKSDDDEQQESQNLATELDGGQGDINSTLADEPSPNNEDEQSDKEPINPCLGAELSSDSSIENIIYYVGYTDEITIDAPQYLQSVANCPLTYSLIRVDQEQEQELQESQEQALQLQEDGSIRLDISNNRELIDQLWTLRLKLTSLESEAAERKSINLDFSVEFLDGCVFDTLTKDSQVDDFDYYLDYTGLYQILAPSYTQLIKGCVVEWTLDAVDDGQEQELQEEISQYVQLRADGSVDVDFGSAKNYTGVWKFRLEVESVKSTVDTQKTVSYEFSMNLLDGCMKDELTQGDQIEDFKYYVGVTGQHVIERPLVEQTQGNCPVTWSLQSFDQDTGSIMPLSDDETQYVSLESGGTIIVNTGSESQLADESWTLALTVTSDFSTSETSKAIQYQFTVTFLDGCPLDELTEPSIILNLEYFVNFSGSRVIEAPHYTQSVLNCVVSWTLFITDETGAEQALTPIQEQYVALQQDGQITLQAITDKDMVGEEWQMKLKATSVESSSPTSNSVEYLFSVTLLDGCMLDVLEPMGQIADHSMYINATNAHTIQAPAFDQLVPNCPISWSLQLSVNGTSNDLSHAVKEYIQLQKDGSILFNPNNRSNLTAEIFSLTLRATSDQSTQGTGNFIDYEFTLTLISPVIQPEIQPETQPESGAEDQEETSVDITVTNQTDDLYSQTDIPSNVTSSSQNSTLNETQINPQDQLNNRQQERVSKAQSQSWLERARNSKYSNQMIYFTIIAVIWVALVTVIWCICCILCKKQQRSKGQVPQKTMFDSQTPSKVAFTVKDLELQEQNTQLPETTFNTVQDETRTEMSLTKAQHDTINEFLPRKILSSRRDAASGQENLSERSEVDHNEVVVDLQQKKVGSSNMPPETTERTTNYPQANFPVQVVSQVAKRRKTLEQQRLDEQKEEIMFEEISMYQTNQTRMEAEELQPYRKPITPGVTDGNFSER